VSQRPRTEIRQTQRLALSLGLAASIRVLRQDATGLTMYLEEQAAENPWLQIDRSGAPPGEWLPRWSGVLAQMQGHADTPIEAAGAGPSLLAHVTGAIDRAFPQGRMRQTAMLFAGALEPSGWLGRPLPALAAGLTLPQAESFLRRLQDIEPAGLFARNLAECLELQCREAGWLDAPMRVVLGRLDLLAAGETDRLARAAGISAEDVLRLQRRIRSLNPKPGAQFDPGAAPMREPDLIVTRGPLGWQVALNRSALPDVSLAPANGTKTDPAARVQRDAARAVCRQVQARGATLLRLGTEILRRQHGIIERGATALVPMTMAEVAEATGLHESTVSRAVAGAAIDTPAGTFWLRAMFSGGLKQRDRPGAQPADTAPDGPAAAALRARLARIIAAEDPANPLSDAALADSLAADLDTPMSAPARRTIAKYRAMLSIPPAHRRRSRR
jgi:RNA polymerase sigma-54 factor